MYSGVTFDLQKSAAVPLCETPFEDRPLRLIPMLVEFRFQPSSSYLTAHPALWICEKPSGSTDRGRFSNSQRQHDIRLF